ASAHCKRWATAPKRARCRRAPLPLKRRLRTAFSPRLARRRQHQDTARGLILAGPIDGVKLLLSRRMYEINAVPRRRRAPSRYAKRRVRWLAFQDTRFARWRAKTTLLRTRKRALQFEPEARTV